MQIVDQEQWQKGLAANLDPYGRRCFTYAEEWADLLEKRIPEGATDPQITRIFADHAEDDAHAADTDGITVFMYGAAVSILAATWKYGDLLRRWHNLKMQIGTEGERANEKGSVLNPALLNVSPRKS
jgi:hypothetical protein